MCSNLPPAQRALRAGAGICSQIGKSLTAAALCANRVEPNHVHRRSCGDGSRSISEVPTNSRKSMQDHTSPAALNELTTMKFGVGQPVRRTEDPVLVRGQGHYTDDLNIAGQAHAV